MNHANDHGVIESARMTPHYRLLAFSNEAGRINERERGPPKDRHTWERDVISSEPPQRALQKRQRHEPQPCHIIKGIRGQVFSLAQANVRMNRHWGRWEGKARKLPAYSWLTEKNNVAVMRSARPVPIKV